MRRHLFIVWCGILAMAIPSGFVFMLGSFVWELHQTSILTSIGVSVIYGALLLAWLTTILWIAHEEW